MASVTQTSAFFSTHQLSHRLARQLGVESTASAKEIRRAYFQKSRSAKSAAAGHVEGVGGGFSKDQSMLVKSW
jgi:hypothetical protein